MEATEHNSMQQSRKRHDSAEAQHQRRMQQQLPVPITALATAQATAPATTLCGRFGSCFRQVALRVGAFFLAGDSGRLHGLSFDCSAAEGAPAPKHQRIDRAHGPGRSPLPLILFFF